MKVYALPAGEDWVCDRFCKEWLVESGHGTKDPWQADIVWLLSDWCWKHLPLTLLQQKPVIVTVHHVVPQKFGPTELAEFIERDKFVTAYHVPCRATYFQLIKIFRDNGLRKPVLVQPFWVNNETWFPTDHEEIRNSLGIRNEFIVGSFQRDTEGHNLISPKLEKGPDIFCDAIIKLDNISRELLLPPVKVLLAGWRRQYVIARLDATNIPYIYEELPSFDRLNQLYNALDCYVVSSRYEGGPQAIVECASIGIPVVSRNVGVASEILHPECVGDDIVNMMMRYNASEESRAERIKHALDKVSPLHMNFQPFLDFFLAMEKRSRFSQLSPGIGERKTDV